MKKFLFSAAALSLPAGAHAFLASMQPATALASTRLHQEQYYNQQGGQYYDQDGQPIYDQQQYYDEHGQPIYAQDPTQQYNQQQQNYPDQQQGADPSTYNPAAEEPSLLIIDDMQGEMARATANVDVGGLDYLALARQRAAARVPSNNSQSTDADWLNLAEEKRAAMGDLAAFAEDEDWEKSLDDEGGMSDSAALGLGVKLEEGEGGVMMTEGGLVVDNNEGGDEPQLLL